MAYHSVARLDRQHALLSKQLCLYISIDHGPSNVKLICLTKARESWHHHTRCWMSSLISWTSLWCPAALEESHPKGVQYTAKYTQEGVCVVVVWYRLLLRKCFSTPFYEHRLTLIPAWIGNYIHHNECNEIVNPFPKLDGETYLPWWRYDMEILHALLTLCQGTPPITRWFPYKLPVLRFGDLSVSLNKLLNKQADCNWFETPWRLFGVTILALPGAVARGFLTQTKKYGKRTHVMVFKPTLKNNSFKLRYILDQRATLSPVMSQVSWL